MSFINRFSVTVLLRGRNSLEVELTGERLEGIFPGSTARLVNRQKVVMLRMLLLFDWLYYTLSALGAEVLIVAVESPGPSGGSCVNDRYIAR